jgi:hypothetical protein
MNACGIALCVAVPVNMLYGNGETLGSRRKLSIGVESSVRFGIVSQGRNKVQ